PRRSCTARLSHPAPVGRPGRFRVPPRGAADRRDPRRRAWAARRASHPERGPLVRVRERRRGQPVDAGVFLNGYSAGVKTNPRIFYGWWIVAAFSVMTFTSTGIRHAVGPFLKPIVADLGLDRASFSAVIALSLFLYGVFMPIVGVLLDRFSVRFVT